MSVPQRGEIEIELGGEKRSWLLTWRQCGEIENAVAQFEGKRIGWSKYLQRAMDWGIADWGLVLWAGLHARDKSITLDYVMDTATHDVFSEFQAKFWTLGEERIPDAIKKKMVEAAQ